MNIGDYVCLNTRPGSTWVGEILDLRPPVLQDEYVYRVYWHTDTSGVDGLSLGIGAGLREGKGLKNNNKFVHWIKGSKLTKLSISEAVLRTLKGEAEVY